MLLECTISSKFKLLHDFQGRGYPLSIVTSRFLYHLRFYETLWLVTNSSEVNRLLVCPQAEEES